MFFSSLSLLREQVRLPSSWNAYDQEYRYEEAVWLPQILPAFGKPLHYIVFENCTSKEAI